MQVTKSEAIALTEQFIAHQLPNEPWYRNCKPYIKAILLYGSVAKGTNRPDSDIDLLVLMPLQVEEKYTTGEYFYSYEGHEINLVIRSIERLRKIAEEREDKFQKEVFRQAAILNAADDEAEKLLHRLIN